MHFLSAALENYIAEHSEEEPELLRELTRETHLKVIQPRMITGHVQGRFLSILSKIIAPKTILEIGTYTGYSALCLAEGLAPNGQLHTIEINAELESIQNSFIEKSDFRKKITQHFGDAKTIIPKLEAYFDLIFIDAKKTDYDAYLEAVLPKTKSGSVILSDNVLWSGKVLDPPAPTDQATNALVAYNRKLQTDPRLETILLPIRDGITLSRVV